MNNFTPKKVVVSGFWQILHAGHIDYINEASQWGQVIAIVNSDYQTQFKDTPSIITEQDRAKIIRNIKAIHDVVISVDKDESVAVTLEALRPDIFFNSGDRNTSNINPKEKEVCDRLGIKIMYGKGKKINSSSGIINRIKNS